MSSGDEGAFHLVRQKVFLELDFELEEIYGWTCMTIASQTKYPERVILHCSDQCVVEEILVETTQTSFRQR